MTDESTDVTSNKFTCIVIRYFNFKTNKQVTSSFFDLVDLFENGVEKATAEVIFDSIYVAIIKCNIRSSVIGFGSDNCNTMMGKKNSVKSRFEESCPNIYVSKCVCHSMAICASQASKDLPHYVRI